MGWSRKRCVRLYLFMPSLKVLYSFIPSSYFSLRNSSILFFFFKCPLASTAHPSRTTCPFRAHPPPAAHSSLLQALSQCTTPAYRPCTNPSLSTCSSFHPSSRLSHLILMLLINRWLYFRSPLYIPPPWTWLWSLAAEVTWSRPLKIESEESEDDFVWCNGDIWWLKPGGNQTAVVVQASRRCWLDHCTLLLCELALWAKTRSEALFDDGALSLEKRLILKHLNLILCLSWSLDRSPGPRL